MSGRAGYPEFGMEALGGKKESDREEERGKGGQERRRKEKRLEEKRRGQLSRMVVKDVTAPCFM